MPTKLKISGIGCAFAIMASCMQFVGNSQAHNGSADREQKAVFMADPSIFYHDGLYYLYGTSGFDADGGFEVYTSKDMQTWIGPVGANNGFALRKGDAFGDKGFWAPQVFHYRDTYYMAYTANENIAIATAKSPLGPFTQTNKQPLAAPVKQIDPYVFIDDNGKKYLYHVRLKEGNRIFVAELTDDFSAIKEESLQECISAEASWENTRKVNWPVAEGPAILKHKDLYYLIYSANDFRNPDYAVGYAVSSHPLGPWKKFSGNPILSKKGIGQNGPGHGDFIQKEGGELYYVFHTHFSENEVSPRRTALIKAEFKEVRDSDSGEERLVMEEDHFYFIKEEN